MTTVHISVLMNGSPNCQNIDNIVSHLSARYDFSSYVAGNSPFFRSNNHTCCKSVSSDNIQPCSPSIQNNDLSCNCRMDTILLKAARWWFWFLPFQERKNYHGTLSSDHVGCLLTTVLHVQLLSLTHHH